MTSKQAMLSEAVERVNRICDKVGVSRPAVKVLDTMNSLGRYYRSTSEIFINLSKTTNGYAMSPAHDLSPQATLYHEAAHHFIAHGVIEHAPASTVSLYASRNDEERTCEAFMVWMLDPDYFRLIDKHYCNFLDTTFGETR